MRAGKSLRVYYTHGIGTIYTGIFGELEVHLFAAITILLLKETGQRAFMDGAYIQSDTRQINHTHRSVYYLLELFGQIMAGRWCYYAVLNNNNNNAQSTLLFDSDICHSIPLCRAFMFTTMFYQHVAPSSDSARYGDSAVVGFDMMLVRRQNTLHPPSHVLVDCLPIFETDSGSQARDEVGGTVPG